MMGGESDTTPAALRSILLPLGCCDTKLGRNDLFPHDNSQPIVLVFDEMIGKSYDSPFLADQRGCQVQPSANRRMCTLHSAGTPACVSEFLRSSIGLGKVTLTLRYFRASLPGDPSLPPARRGTVGVGRLQPLLQSTALDAAYSIHTWYC
jgi:hypothetical protein